MESIWEQIARIEERQVELEQSVLPLSHEREELEQELEQMQNVGIRAHSSTQARHDILVQRQRALTEATEEHRRTINRLIEEFDTESASSSTDTESTASATDTEIAASGTATDYTEVAGTDSDESCPDDEKITMICTCDCNVKEANLF